MPFDPDAFLAATEDPPLPPVPAAEPAHSPSNYTAHPGGPPDAFDPDAFLATTAPRSARPLAHVTDYGQRDDPYLDTLTATGHSAIGKLQPDSMAVSPDVEQHLRAQGARIGDPVVVTLSNGTTLARRWDDRTSAKLRGRVDLYSPAGPHPTRGASVVAVTPAGRAAQTGTAISAPFDPDAFLAATAPVRPAEAVPMSDRDFLNVQPAQPAQRIGAADLPQWTPEDRAATELLDTPPEIALTPAAQAASDYQRARTTAEFEGQGGSTQSLANEIEKPLVSRENIEALGAIAGHPELAKQFIDAVRPHGKGAGAGVVRGVENVAASLSTPENLALMATLAGAPEAIGKAAATYFGAQMLKAAPETALDAADAAKAGDSGTAAELATEAALTAAMARSAVKHAAGSRPVDATAARIAKLAEKTNKLPVPEAPPAGTPGAPLQKPIVVGAPAPEAAPKPNPHPTTSHDFPAPDHDPELAGHLAQIERDNRVALLAEAAADPTLTSEQRVEATRLWAEARKNSEPPAAKSSPAIEPAQPAPEVPTTTAVHPDMVETVEFPVEQLKLSADVPNFKGGASKQTGARAATTAHADRWWQGALRVLGKAAGRQLGVRLGSPEALREAGVTHIPADAQALWSAKLRSIFLLNKGLELGATRLDVLNLLHESGHALWDTLHPKVQASLTRLWEAERSRRTGPLYENGKLKSDDARVEHDVQEWFAERVAHANLDWGAKRLQAATHDGSLFGSIAAEARLRLVRLRQALFNEGADVVTRKMRRFMDKGAAQYAGPRAAIVQRTPDTQEDHYANGHVAGPASAPRFAIRNKLTPYEALLVGPMVPRDIHSLYEGAADRFLRTRGLEFLGRAIQRHVDRARALQGALTAPFRAWEQSHSRADRNKAFVEFEEFQRQRDIERDPAIAAGKIRQRGAPSGRLPSPQLYQQASPAGRALIDHWASVASRVANYNAQLGVQVQDAQGRWRPIGRVTDYFPRSLKPEILRAILDPRANPKAWREAVREMISAGVGHDEAAVVSVLDQRFRDKAYTDFLGNIEQARQLPMPHRLYDYSFGAARRYLLGWAERAAQIEAFGQKTGRGTKDLFDRAQERTHDAATREYIDATRRRAYNERMTGTTGKVLAGVNSLATGLQLGNPITIGVNLLSGLGYNVTTMGLRHSIRGLVELRTLGATINDAHARGLLLDDMMSMMHDADQYGSGTVQGIQRFTAGVLKWTGYNASETFVRAHGLLTAKSFLRAAQAAHDRAPNSRAARTYEGWFRRNNLDPVKLMNERGAGPATDRFFRESVNAGQGGYRYDQVPIFTDTPIGRFLFKYQKWGTQATRNFSKNAVAPLLRPGVDANGKTLPRSIVPLMRYMVVTGALGAAVVELKRLLFGSPDSSASLAEIGNTMNEDQARGFALLGQKIVNSWLAAGAGGIIGNYYQGVRDVAERSRFKNPLSPPALAPFDGLRELGRRLFEQGGKLTPHDIDEILRSSASAWRTLESGAARGLDAAGAHVEPFEREARRQDLSWLGTVTRRYAAEIGEPGTRTSIGRVAKTSSSPLKTELRDALMEGDTASARETLREILATYPDTQSRSDALRSLGASVRASQPIHVGAASEPRRLLFLKWAQRRLDPEDVARITTIDRTYRHTAAQLGLLHDDREVSDAQLADAMRRTRVRAGR